MSSICINSRNLKKKMADATVAAAREEALRTAEEAFAKLDLNGDGNVDKEELRKIAADSSVNFGGEMDVAAREAKIDEFFATFDANGDGKVQKQEWLDFFGGLFDAVVQQAMDGN